MTGPADAIKTWKAIWRWHFYAGLIVAPFLVILSISGMVYLFNDEINDAAYPHLRKVAPGTVYVQTTAMVAAALQEQPGVPTRIDLPGKPDWSTVIYIQPDEGLKRLVYVDPYTGKALGKLIYENTLVGWADKLHGSLMLGTIGDNIVELAACWALVLVVTGLYLWWPRGLKGLGGVLYPRLWGKNRMLWRDLHAVTGIWSSFLIAFLILTGLPWSDIQGNVLKNAIASAGIGYPESTRNYGAPKSVGQPAQMKDALGEAPWTLENAPMPQSNVQPPKPDAHAGHPGHSIAPATADEAALANLDMIVFHLSEHGLVSGYRLFMPAGPEGVYTAYTYPDQPEGQRTLYFDRYSHQLIREVGFTDYGWAAKAIELGVQLHMGNYFGLANQLLMLIPCLAILFLVASGFTMWWKRRPEGKLAAPPKVEGARTAVALAILVGAGLMFPLMGASLIVVFAVDQACVWIAKRRAA